MRRPLGVGVVHVDQALVFQGLQMHHHLHGDLRELTQVGRQVFQPGAVGYHLDQFPADIMEGLVRGFDSLKLRASREGLAIPVVPAAKTAFVA